MTTSKDLAQLIHDIPKAELHLHIEGTLEPELMMQLAQRNQVSIKFSSVEEIRAAYEFGNLQSFLDIYYEGAQVLLLEEDFYDLTWQYLKKVAGENVRHVEIFFDPQTHTERGVEFATVIRGINRALEDAKRDLKVSSRLIMCFLRHLSADDAERTLEQSLEFKDWIVAVGLDSSEVGHPPSKFAEVFDRARQHGYLTVAHAGEEGPPEYIYEALDLLGVSRIDHGVRCIEDPALVERLAASRIPLTVCPLSNVKLGVYPSLDQHNLKKLLDKGLCITINSDDPAYFGGYIEENFLQTRKALNLAAEDIRLLAANSFEASFLGDKDKATMIKQVDEAVRTFHAAH